MIPQKHPVATTKDDLEFILIEALREPGEVMTAAGWDQLRDEALRKGRACMGDHFRSSLK